MKKYRPLGKTGLEMLGQLGSDRASDFGDGYDVEVDPLKRNHISCGTDGIWVRAWLHIPNSTLREAGILNPEDPGDDE